MSPRPRRSTGEARSWASERTGEVPRGEGGESSNAKRLDGRRELAVGDMGPLPERRSSSTEADIGSMESGISVGAAPLAMLKNGDPIIELENAEPNCRVRCRLLRAEVSGKTGSVGGKACVGLETVCVRDLRLR